MATATRVVQDSKREVVYTPQPDRIRLDLSLEEAETLLTVLGSIGGSQDSARRFTEAVHEALLATKIQWHMSTTLGLGGTLHFRDDVSPSTQHRTGASPLGGGGCGRAMSDHKGQDRNPIR